jgi:hypothetical protein
MYKIIGADGKEYGPIPAEILRQWIAEGRANAMSRVLPEGSADWRTLAELPEFSGALGAAAAPALVPGPITAPQPAARTNTLALTGMILGICSLLFACCCFGLPFNVAGLLCSVIGLVQIHNDPAREQGKGLAVAGLILSLTSILGAILLHFFANADLMREFRRF